MPGDRGAHGMFDNRALDSSPALWAAKNRDLLALVGVGIVGGIALTTLLASPDQNKPSASPARTKSPASKKNSEEYNEPPILAEAINQFNRATKKDKFQMLMGLTIRGLKVLAG